MSLTLLNGDCLEVMKTLPDKSVDCFICDLPYGQLDKSRPADPENSNHLHYSGKGQTGCSWDVKIDLAKFWEQVERLAKNDHVPIIHFCNTKFGIDLINSKPSWFRYDLVWNKERGVSFLLANKMPMKSHEMIYIFSKKAAYYNRIDIVGDFKPYKAIDNESTTRVVKVGSGRLKSDGNDGTTRCALSVITVDETPKKKEWKRNRAREIEGKAITSKQYGATRAGDIIQTGGEGGKRCVLSVINMSKPNTKGHPTEKPLALYHWLIERYCPKGGTVLDPTAGSFNSVEAAHDIGRHGIGIEMDDGFYKIAKERLQPEQQQEETNEFIPPASE